MNTELQTRKLDERFIAWAAAGALILALATLAVTTGGGQALDGPVLYPLAPSERECASIPLMSEALETGMALEIYPSICRR